MLNDDRADWREAWALFPGDVAYVWHGALHAATVADSLVVADFAIRSQIIRAKDRLVLSRGDYHWQHEPCWYAVRAKGNDSLNAAALVWSNAPVIVGAHDTGPLIRSPNGFWLAIPTPAAGKSTRGGRIPPGEWERRTGLRLRFNYRRRGPSLLVVEGRLNSKGRAVASRAKTGRGLTTVPIFLLVPQVKLRKRLDLARDAERTIDGVPGRIVAAWVGGVV